MAVKKTKKAAAPKKQGFEGDYKESYTGFTFILIFMFLMNVLKVQEYTEVFFPIAISGIMGELIYNYKKTKAPIALLGAVACLMYLIYVACSATGLIMGMY